MPEIPWTLISIGGFALGVGFVPLIAWLRTLRRLPCPHCGKRSRRSLAGHRLAVDRLRPHALTYQCRSCDGMMRYARWPTGQEYWERLDAPGD